MQTKSSFTINSSNKSFAEKQKNLFNELNNAEKSHKLTLPQESEMEIDETIDKNRQRSSMKHYKKQESIFKRPEAPISKCLPVGRVPGFRKNPQKWTKYTLKDVKDEDISDKGNTKAALSFLKELEERNKIESDETDDVPDKITFKKSAIVKKMNQTEPTDKPTFRSSKLVMPEYIVGQKVQKEKKTKKLSSTLSTSKQLKLDHLLDEVDA